MNESVSEELECVIRETGPDPEHAVIWLHGLGADGHDFEPIVQQLAAATRRPVRFVFPHAPVRPVTVNGGMAMRAWYDIRALEIDRDEDSEGIASALAAVDRLVDAQHEAGIDGRNLVLAGFSQGGAIALRCGLARSMRLAGIVALSTYLLDARRLEQWTDPAGAGMPIFCAHGDQDPVVPVALGRHSAERLRAAGYQVSWQTWDMPHAVCPEEIAALDQWLEQCWS